MASRLKLHEELCELLGTKNVYFQPPESLRLVYPCIVYSKAGVNKLNANNKLYNSTNEYDLTVIDHDPDSEIPDRILAHFPMCRFDRYFASENLNHYSLNLYY